MKIATIVGARPQFIKAAVVSRAIKAHSEKEILPNFRPTGLMNEVIIHTGQHFDSNMSEIFFQEMNIPNPLYNLNINSLSHGAMTGQMIEKIEEVLMIEQPEWVLLYGDTNSTLAGSIAAKKLHIKIAHIEAGLRMFDMKNPEEINRLVTDRLSDILFCPSLVAVENLLNEGFGNFDCKVINCGDVMYDAVLYYQCKAKKPNLSLPSRFTLCTMHRAENTDDTNSLNNIMQALEEVSKVCPVVFPIHPRTRNKLINANYNFLSSNIHFIEPVGYLEMVWLLKNCELVFTDSGGLQKEAYFFEKYCIIFNDKTPWVEINTGGLNKLVGNDKTKIIEAFHYFFTLSKLGFGIQLYGDGNAGVKIVDSLLHFN